MPSDNPENQLSFAKLNKFGIKMSASSCSGTETNVKSFSSENNPDYFSRIKLSKIRTYFCDGNPIGVDTIYNIFDDYYQGTEPEPIPTVDLSGVLGYNTLINYTNCSSVYFDINNIINYNLSQFQSRPSDAAMLRAIYDNVVNFQYEYSGSYILDDLDGQYGQGSKDKLIFAVFGHFCAQAFGTNKFNAWISNVPATSGFGLCDQVRFKSVCLTGASNFNSYSYSNYNDMYNYYIQEIVAIRM